MENRKIRHNRIEDFTFEELNVLTRDYFDKELEEANKFLDEFYKLRNKKINEEKENK